ncbi:unnamed protein product [Camellia sinensis]
MCDRIAAVGIDMNLITYLIEKLNLPIVSASNTLTNFGGAASFMPLIGALIADSFAGRFWTILFDCIIYQLWNGEPPLASDTATASALSKPNSRELPGSLIPTTMGRISELELLQLKVKPGGSPLVRLVQVIAVAWKKRKEVEPEDLGMLYQSKELDALISSNGRLLHPDQFKWLDRAAILTEDDAKETNFPNLWRLATVHRVEELKSIIRVLPIWGSGILLIASHANQGTFGILQARSMDRSLFHSHSIQIPPASMSIFSILTVLVGLVLYD